MAGVLGQAHLLRRPPYDQTAAQYAVLGLLIKADDGHADR